MARIAIHYRMEDGRNVAIWIDDPELAWAWVESLKRPRGAETDAALRSIVVAWCNESVRERA